MTLYDGHLRSHVTDLVALARRAGLERTLEFQLHILRLQCDQAVRYRNESLARKVRGDAEALRRRIEAASAASPRAARSAGTGEGARGREDLVPA